MAQASAARHSETGEFDAVVVGAGFAGLYMLHRLRGLGFTARVYEAGVGGTWYWNRYPGARCDVESLQYSFSFSEELDQERNWSEKYSPQPEILTYVNHVADRFDLRSQIVFDTRVTAATFNEDTDSWLIETDRGDRVTANSASIYHTGEWPHEGVDFKDLCVGIIGTGSSAVQSIPIIAREASQLTVFRRTATWSVGFCSVISPSARLRGEGPAS
jgi:cation diffusion facilitator CzcD-associated flavoprotein CzcO